MRGLLAAGLIGLIDTVVAAAAAPDSPLVTIGAAVIASGLVTAWFSARERRRSGEGRGAAAQSVGIGADEVAKGATQLVTPLNQRITELLRQNAELEAKVAAARRESYERALAAADREKDILRLQREAEAQHALDRAEVHECRGGLAVAAVERAGLLDRITTLEVQLGAAPERRGDDRRAT
jgi:hypothetical protein